MMSSIVLIMLTIENPRVDEQDVVAVLRRAFADVAAGAAVAPGQFVVDLPGGGDVIHYPGLLADAGVYCVKVSPYLPQPAGKAIVSAWTVLMSTATGEPIALVNAGNLTTERTAATSALAADLLLPAGAATAAIIGLGKVGQAHVRYLRTLRPDLNVRAYARTRPSAVPAGVTLADTIAEATAGTDLVMLCTSAAADVIDPRRLAAGTVVTSISTNAPGAREIPGAAVADLDVYLDARTTVSVATELRDATASGWNPGTVRGTLADLVAGSAARPDGNRVVYFRSVGLGIEDAAVAWAAYRAHHEARS